MGKFIKATGEITEVSPVNGKAFSMEEFQGFVSGYFEFVRVIGGLTMAVNEEGSLKNLPLNNWASNIARRPIVGDVVIF